MLRRSRSLKSTKHSYEQHEREQENRVVYSTCKYIAPVQQATTQYTATRSRSQDHRFGGQISLPTLASDPLVAISTCGSSQHDLVSFDVERRHYMEAVGWKACVVQEGRWLSIKRIEYWQSMHICKTYERCCVPVEGRNVSDGSRISLRQARAKRQEVRKSNCWSSLGRQGELGLLAMRC